MSSPCDRVFVRLLSTRVAVSNRLGDTPGVDMNWRRVPLYIVLMRGSINIFFFPRPELHYFLCARKIDANSSEYLPDSGG